MYRISYNNKLADVFEHSTLQNCIDKLTAQANTSGRFIITIPNKFEKQVDGEWQSITTGTDRDTIDTAISNWIQAQ